VIVEPGEVTTPHTQEGQADPFVAPTGGQIAIDEEVHDVRQGSLVRVNPETVGNLLNRTGNTRVRLAVGAPPVGTVDDFGAYVVME
jgi:hypothetical protein